MHTLVWCVVNPQLEPISALARTTNVRTLSC